MSDLPCQVLIPPPSLGQFQKPFLVERIIDEWRMQQMWEVLNGPVVEDDYHTPVLCYTLSY